MAVYLTKIGRKRAYIQVICTKCSVSYLKRKDTPVSWSGLCKVCHNKIPHRLGKYSKRKSCVTCGKVSYWIKTADKCKPCLNKFRVGSAHPRWKKDRSTVIKRQERNDAAYKAWRKEVWLRDNFKCKIANPDCAGRIEAHHILGWKDYPELRYIINNGITLCHAHHPRVRAEEKRLSPYFQSLVSVSK